MRGVGPANLHPVHGLDLPLDKPRLTDGAFAVTGVTLGFVIDQGHDVPPMGLKKLGITHLGCLDGLTHQNLPLECLGGCDGQPFQ